MIILQQTIQQWKYAFLIGAAWLIGCGIVYVLFTNSNLQHWNTSKSQAHQSGKELEVLKPKENDATKNNKDKGGDKENHVIM